jgi:putative DNA primase/helicase
MAKNAKFVLTKSANIEDLLTGEAVEEFTFPKIGGGRGKTTLKPSEVLDRERLHKHLLDRNAELPADMGKRMQLIEKVASMQPERLIVQPARMGWQNNHQGFLAATGSLGDCGRHKMALPSWLTDKHLILQRQDGTLDGWVDEVARRCCNSSAALTALCASFAAPLLTFRGMSPFGVNIFGISKAGKSTALLSAASFGGIGNENYLPNFRSTAPARGQLCCAFNDQILPLNEVGLLGGKKAAYESIRELIYQVSEGREAIRHSESKYAMRAEAAEFRTIFVSTSEHSFDQYARLAGQRRDEGEYARCIDVPACKPGGTSIMDRAPKSVAPRDRKSWRRTEVIALRKACAEQHGHALRAFMDHLIALHAEGQLADEIDRGQKAFLSHFIRDSLEGALQHAARNFALLAAGGRLAIQAKLLPIKEKVLIAILVDVFERATSNIAIFQSPEKVVKAILAKRLQKVPELAAKAKWDEKAMGKGFSRLEEGKRVYIIDTKEFRSWFGRNEMQVDAALEFLKRRGRLIEPGERTGQPQNTLFGRSTTFRIWPDDTGKGRRAIAFRSPFPPKAMRS